MAKYALVGVDFDDDTQDEVRLHIEAANDTEAWEKANDLEFPPRFYAGIMIEYTDVGERDVPLPKGVLEDLVKSIAEKK